MSLSLFSAPLAFAPAPLRASAPASNLAAASVRMETIADLEVLAKECNPVVGYFNPLGLGEGNGEYETESPESAIGYLRHAEIKHGRIAMFAFVGFIVQSNGIHFPWALTTSGITFADIAAAGGPAAQWDALPTVSKLQIFGFIFFLEVWGEGSNTLAAAGEKHYMRGGKPGFFPPFGDLIPHPIPLKSLYDPLGVSKNASPEKKAKGLITEINNGRAAMIGIMAFVSEARVPGSVPALQGLITPYDGECMAPFSAGDTALPFVSKMLEYQIPGHF